MLSSLHGIVQSHFFYEAMFLPKLRAHIYLNYMTALLTLLKMYALHGRGNFLSYSFQDSLIMSL